MPTPDIVDYEMRGGSHPDAAMDSLERAIAENAFQYAVSNPIFARKGYRWAYNWTYFHTIWESHNPQIIDLWYRLEPYPRFLEIEATQNCHLKCNFCEHTYWNEPPTDMSFEKFKYAVDQFPNIVWLSPNALGEPFLNKDFWQMLEYRRNEDICGEIYSNTSLLNTNDMRRFVDMQLEYFKFSIDAATKKTYEKIREGISWDKVIANLVALHNWKVKMRSPFPKIMIHYLIMKDTVDEALPFLDFLHSLNIDTEGVMYSRLLHNFKEINHQYIDIPQGLVSKLQAKGKELNIPILLNEDAKEKKPPANECLAWQMPYIFPDGTVISCCCMNEQNRRGWQRENAMGNIFEKPFREIWVDKPYKQLRSMLRDKKIREAHPVCNICNIYNIDVETPTVENPNY